MLFKASFVIFIVSSLALCNDQGAAWALPMILSAIVVILTANT
jgi:hypothetical protein